MDAKRYQQIQDLFWAVEELPRQDQESFLRRTAGDDQELIDEVQSLLREHDADAALIEGRSAKPVRLPGSTKFGTASQDAPAESSSPDSANPDAEQPERADLRKTIPMDRPDQKKPDDAGKTPKPGSGSQSGKASTTKKGPKKDLKRTDGQRTVSGAQRTHAAPRQPRSARHKRGRRSAGDAQSSKSLPTSVGPTRRRFAWVPLWITLALSGIVPIWFTAWSIGGRQIESEQKVNQRFLASVLEQTRLRFETLLSDDRGRSERIAREASRDTIVIDEIDPFGDSSNAQTALDAFMAKQPASVRDESTFVVWDRKFRVVAKASHCKISGEALTARYAGLVARCLEEHPVFIGPASRPSSEDDSQRDSIEDHGDGWMFPVMATTDPDRVVGAVLTTKTTLWPAVNKTLAEIANDTDVDVYLIDRQGIMQTDSRVARAFVGKNGGQTSPPRPFRVAEYAPSGNDESNGNRILPLTVAAASVSTNRGNVVYPSLYPSYHGGYSSGAWSWLPSYSLGLIAEIPVQRYRTALSPTWPWALFASLFVCGIASAVTWWHQNKISSINDARQPLGRYEISRELGSGGMGVVYLARHKELGRDIALKVLRGDRQDEDDRQRFDREARLAASLSCPHSVTVFDFGYTEDDAAFCVMELLHGLTLAEIVARGGSQPPGRVIWIMQQICQSMLEAHGKGLMHRDLKPQNVMLKFDSVVGDWATVFDFGLAKPIEPDQDVFQTSETIWAGTPMYMAPERFRDPSSMDPRSDVYSIGCIAYYLLAGNPPFAECDPESMFALIMSEHPISISTHRNETIDDRLNRWVEDCMRKDKNSRASSIPDLIRSLQAMSDDMPWTRSDADEWWMTHARELHD
ncbi:hypothetical protein FHS27_004480 [Rhodopirellula rubra]|uniref:Protein kinase domain-containing protein n=1 Tax=Aporhodopirellula rubra TaxID=980271 RepID=A0A7W5E2Z7_9BACT|nr:protein kinase [Aporhodopirellula rubra]MBB3208648.1 hypothetical protein [Aporhodopirellula rubra]